MVRVEKAPVCFRLAKSSKLVGIRASWGKSGLGGGFPFARNDAEGNHRPHEVGVGTASGTFRWVCFFFRPSP